MSINVDSSRQSLHCRQTILYIRQNIKLPSTSNAPIKLKKIIFPSNLGQSLSLQSCQLKIVHILKFCCRLSLTPYTAQQESAAILQLALLNIRVTSQSLQVNRTKENALQFTPQQNAFSITNTLNTLHSIHNQNQCLLSTQTHEENQSYHLNY